MPTENLDNTLSAVVQPAAVGSSAENILLNQQLVESVLTTEGNSNTNDLGKLIAQDLEDLEKIHAELDSLACNLPNAGSEASMAVNISNITEEVITSDTVNYLDHVSYTSMSEPVPSETDILSQADTVGVGGDSFIIQDTDHVGDQVTVVTEEVETETLMEQQIIETEMQNIDETQYQIIHVNEANDPNSVINTSSYVIESSPSVVSMTPSVTALTIPTASTIESILPTTSVATVSKVSIPQTKVVASMPVNIGNMASVELTGMAGCPKIITTTSNLNLPTKVIGTIPGKTPPSVLGIQSTGQNAPLTILNTSGMKFGGKQVMFVQKPFASSTTSSSILTPGTKLISSTSGTMPVAGKSTVTTTIIPDMKISTSSKKPAPLLVPVTIAQNQSAGGSQTVQIPMSLANFKGDMPIKVIMSQNSKGGSNPVQITTSTMNLLQSLAGGGKNIITTMAGGQFMNKTVKIVQAPTGTQFSSSATGTNISGGNIITLANQGGAQKATGQQPTILLASPNKTATGFKGNPQIIRAFTGNPNNKQSVVLLSPVKGKPGTFQNLTLKSPQKIAPAPNTIPSGARFTIVSAPQATAATTSTSVTSGGVKQQQKVILRPIVPVVKPSVSTATTSASQSKQIMVPVSRVITGTNSSVQPIQVPGNKFNYVRLVSAPLNQGASTSKSGIATTAKTATLVPVSSIRTPTSQQGVALATTAGGNQVRFALNLARPSNTGNQQANSKVNIQQRLIVPGNATKISSAQLRGLPPGSIIQTTNSATGQPSFVMVSAQYMAQLQQGQNSSTGTKVLPVLQPARTILQASGSTNSGNNFVPIAAAVSSTPLQSFDQTSGQNSNIVPSHAITTMRQMNGRAPPPELLDNRPRKPCNCTKSQCLKLYCDCFANGEFCNNCNCTNCANNLEKENDRQKAIKSCLDRNPMAFHPKIGKTRKGKDGDHERSHTKGCNCKRSGCLKNYCECYEAKILCTNLCRCSGCKNFEDSNERKTLMHLADAAEVRVQQQLAAKDKISSQLLDLPARAPIISLTGERLPFSFVTQEVTEATCGCMLARAEEAERSDISLAVLEKEILEEFGRCLKQIIDCSNKTRAS